MWESLKEWMMQSSTMPNWAFAIGFGVMFVLVAMNMWHQHQMWKTDEAMKWLIQRIDWRDGDL